MQFKLMPIGHVVTDATHEELRHRTAVSKIIIDRKYARGLKDLEGFSHLDVLLMLHEAPRWKGNLMVHPRGRTDLKERGIFATRSPHRPNPIALTLVKLLSKRGRVLTVEGLDAYNGTPVLDLKPYDRLDITPNFRVPLWWKKLQRENRRGECAHNAEPSRRVQRRGKLGSRTR